MKKWCGILFLLLFILGCKVKLEQQNGIIIENITIDKLEGDKHSISFNIKNLNNSAADCYVNVFLGEEEIPKDAGIIKANSEEKKQIDLTLKQEETQIKIEPVCRWIDESIVQECNTGDYADRRVCEFVLNKPELQQCLVSNIAYYKLFCIAVISKRPEICDHIIMSDSKKNWCKAYVTKDTNFCSNILDEKEEDWCYVDLGMNFQDLTICDKIHDEELKASCTAVATNNPNLCLDGAEEFKVICVTNIVSSTGNKELCSLLSNEQKKECFEQVKWQ